MGSLRGIYYLLPHCPISPPPLPFPHPKREPLVRPHRDFIFLPRNVTWFYERPSSRDLKFWNSGEILWTWLLIKGHEIWGFWRKWADAFVATDFCVTWFSRKFHCFIFCVTKSWIWPILNFCVFIFVFPLWAQSDFCSRVDSVKIRDQGSSGRTNNVGQFYILTVKLCTIFGKSFSHGAEIKRIWPVMGKLRWNNCFHLLRNGFEWKCLSHLDQIRAKSAWRTGSHRYDDKARPRAGVFFERWERFGQIVFSSNFTFWAKAEWTLQHEALRENFHSKFETTAGNFLENYLVLQSMNCLHF